jgi:hypothetical protein
MGLGIVWVGEGSEFICQVTKWAVSLVQPLGAESVGGILARLQGTVWMSWICSAGRWLGSALVRWALCRWVLGSI